MKKYILLALAGIGLIMFLGSCSKDKVKPAVSNKQITLGLYEYGVDSGKRVFIPVTKIGSQVINYCSVFDTGSAGMTSAKSGLSTTE